MNRLQSVAFRLAVAAIVLFFSVSTMRAQTPPAPAPAQAPDKAAGGEEENPFAPTPAPVQIGRAHV